MHVCVICAFPLVRLLMLQVLTKSGRDIQYMEDKIGRVLKDLTSCLWIDVCGVCMWDVWVWCVCVVFRSLPSQLDATGLLYRSVLQQPLHVTLN